MINREKIMEMIGCDSDFVNQLLEQFVIECTDSVKKINEAYANNDWQIIRGVSHKMLSSSRILTLDNLTTLLKEIETLAENRTNLEKMPSLLEKLNTEIKLIFSELKDIK
ncbi:MAG: Hpt domain-containing protein [Flavobacteriales bacterium]